MVLFVEAHSGNQIGISGLVLSLAFLFPQIASHPLLNFSVGASVIMLSPVISFLLMYSLWLANSRQGYYTMTNPGY